MFHHRQVLILTLVLTILALVTSDEVSDNTNRTTIIRECITAIRALNFYTANEKWQEVAGQDTAQDIVRQVYQETKKPGDLYALLRFIKHMTNGEQAYWMVTSLATALKGAEHQDPVAWLELARALRRYVIHKAPSHLRCDITKTQDEMRIYILQKAKPPLIRAVERGQLANEDSLLRMVGSESLELLERVLEQVAHDTCQTNEERRECVDKVIKIAASKGGVLKQMLEDMRKPHRVTRIPKISSSNICDDV